jgi:transcriptional regulator with GAF, ATPase, and Fis domain
MMPILPQSLSKKLLLTVAFVAIGIGALTSQLVAYYYGERIMHDALSEAENIARNLALNATDKILINDRVALQKLIDDQMISTPFVTYILVIRDSRVLNHTFPNGVPRGLIGLNQLQESDLGQLRRIINEENERYFDVAWPIFDGKAGFIRVGVSEAPYRQKITGLRVRMSLLTLLILMVSLLLCHYLIRRITAPLQQLADAVDKIDEGNLEVNVPVTGDVEVAKLAQAFNQMLVRIKEHTGKLTDYAERLRQKNIELDRSHHQTRASFEISREIGVLPNLSDVCRYLIRKLNDVVTCRSMQIFTFGSGGERLFRFSGKALVQIDGAKSRAAYDYLSRIKKMSFIHDDLDIPVPLETSIPEKPQSLVVFPIPYENELQGAMVITCPGTCKCVTKELDVLQMILEQVAGVLRRTLLQEEEILSLTRHFDHRTGFAGLIGRDPQMQVLYKLIDDIAPSDATVLIQGESGTGKELVARAIHERSLRHNKPFVVINCSAYPATLLESELFGHEKGAFTGAVRQKPGRFEQADGGTVFLDEIGEISPTAQIKLLRILQSKKFERLGGEKTQSIDVRVLAATNRILVDEVQQGTFREDLFYRLNVIPIDLPPLRQRRNDIPLLAKSFLLRFAAEQGKVVQGFDSEVMRRMFSYSWPGNVRELENCIEHAAVLCKGNHITVGDMPPHVVDQKHTRYEHGTPAAPLSNTIARTEKEKLIDVLTQCGWNKKQASQRLGISRSSLYNKLKKYRIAPPTIH